MKRYFSAQGAKRGLVLAALVVLLWGCWAIGYLQGAQERSEQPLAISTIV